MPRFRLAFLAALVIVATALPAHAQEPIRFARTPDISPDGKLVTFSYLGDIWVVDAIGGVARPVTMHEKHEINPVFSPDGKRIAFSSNRHGSYDVFVVPVQGGRPERLTFDSADDMVARRSVDPVYLEPGLRFSAATGPVHGSGCGWQIAPRQRVRGQRRYIFTGWQLHRLCPRAGHLVPQVLPRFLQR